MLGLRWWGVLGIRRERLHNVRCGLLLELGRVLLHGLPGWAALGVGLRGVPAVPRWEVPSRLGSQRMFELPCGNVLCHHGCGQFKRLHAVCGRKIPACNWVHILRHLSNRSIFERWGRDLLHGAAAVSCAPRRRPWISTDPEPAPAHSGGHLQPGLLQQRWIVRCLPFRPVPESKRFHR